MTEINPGDVRRVSGSFTNPAGVATDPTTISVRWRHHRGTETTWVYGTDTQVVRDSAGVFHADIPITVSGLYYYKFEGTGAVQAAEEGTFLAETFFESVAPSTLTGPIRLYTGTADPTTGAGVPAAIGSVYSRTLLGSESVWVKTGAADTAWVQAGSASGGADVVSAGFAWHWNFGLGQTIGADGVWTSTDAAPTIDFDPQGFFVTDGAIVPTGLGGTYYAQVIARFTSATATGFVAVDAVGTALKTRTPVLYDDGTSMTVVWHYMFDMAEGDNTIDVQHFANLTDHDVTLLRVDIRTQRLGPTPA
jgi:hypothetical protein